MAARPQWICWRPVPAASGKIDKIPTDPRRPPREQTVSPLAPSSWMPCDEALALAAKHGLGVGYVFVEDDPFYFLDLDDCLDESRNPSPLAVGLLSRLPGAAIERSTSGRGLHVFGSCAGLFAHSAKNTANHIELYRSHRFAAIGSAVQGLATGSAATDSTDAIQAIAAEFFPPKEHDAADWTTTAREGYRSPMTDAQIIKAACRSTTARQAFSDQASFADLWTADADALALAYPPTGGGDWDGSSADYALASHLAFWTGCNCERIETLMHKSALARDKWDAPREGSTYLRVSIMNAVGSYFGRVLGEDDGAPTPPPPGVDAALATGDGDEGEAPRVRVGRQLLFPDHQREYFAGCVALPTMGVVFVPGYGIVKQAGFKAIYDGPSFVLSNEAGAKTIRNSYEAFTASEANVTPLAHGIVFEPNGPPTTTRYGEVHVNVWRPIAVERLAGDPSPFVDHVRRMLPVGDDAEIFLSYLAAVVQNQGEKFTWCPVVQGVQGNGKSLIARAVELAIGPRYVHQGTEKQLGANFNAWMFGRVLVVVDDIRITRNRSEAMERIKPVITQGRMSVELKGVDAETRDVCANFWLNTNWRDALPIDANERRFAVFYTAQQSKHDLERDGLTEAYFTRFGAWLEADGYAIVAEYLHTIDIAAKWDPSRAGECRRAPRTSSSVAAVMESLPPEAQHILDAIGEDLAGFRGGWVSSTRVRDLFGARRAHVSPRQAAQYLAALGYVRHPALSEGRSPRRMAEDGGRPVLYIEGAHPATLLSDPGDVADAYRLAQEYDAAPGGNVRAMFASTA